jgi:hypothetical protein
MQIKSGIRARCVVSLPEQLGNADIDDKQLAKLIQKGGSPELKKILKSVMKN